MVYWDGSSRTVKSYADGNVNECGDEEVVMYGEFACEMLYNGRAVGQWVKEYTVRVPRTRRVGLVVGYKRCEGWNEKCEEGSEAVCGVKTAN